MATLHLIVGLPCSGKTTLAKQIESEGAALRLTPDEWIERLFGTDAPSEVLDAVRDPIEALLWKIAAKVLLLGRDVILDFGFWSRAERNDFRARAVELGAGCRVHFLNVPETELFERLRARNAQGGAGTFYIDEQRVRDWSRLFEPCTEDELSVEESGR